MPAPSQAWPFTPGTGMGSYPVPNAPWIRGVRVAWQGGAVRNFELTLSNPVIYSH